MGEILLASCFYLHLIESGGGICFARGCGPGGVCLLYFRGRREGSCLYCRPFSSEVLLRLGGVLLRRLASLRRRGCLDCVVCWCLWAARLSWVLVWSGLGGLIRRRSVGSRLAACHADVVWFLFVDPLSGADGFAPVLPRSWFGCAFLMWSLNLSIVNGCFRFLSLWQCGQSTFLLVGVGTLALRPVFWGVWCDTPVEVEGPSHAGGGGALAGIVLG